MDPLTITEQLNSEMDILAKDIAKTHIMNNSHTPHRKQSNATDWEDNYLQIPKTLRIYSNVLYNHVY